MTNYETRFEHFAEFLADTEAMPLDAVISELRAAHVNVDQLVADVKVITGEGSRTQVALRFAGDLARRSKEELMKLLEELEAGPFGAASGSMLPAATHSRYLSRLSDRELRERIEKFKNTQEGHDRDQTVDKA